jgi:hypothetical protein
MNRRTEQRRKQTNRQRTDTQARTRANGRPNEPDAAPTAPDASALRVRLVARPPARSSVRAARSRRYRCRSCGLNAALACAANRRAIRSTAALSLVHSLRGVGDADQDGRGLMEALQPTPLWQGLLRACSLSRVLATPAASCASKLPQVTIRASAQMCARATPSLGSKCRRVCPVPWQM